MLKYTKIVGLQPSQTNRWIKGSLLIREGSEGKGKVKEGERSGS